MEKINLKKVAELEKTYTTSPVFLQTLQRMIDLIMCPVDPVDGLNSTQKLALETLKDLDVIIKDEPDILPNKQLNS